MTKKSSSTAAVGLLLSGGLDSGILLGHLLEQGRRLQPFYVRSHLHWEAAEQKAVRGLLKHVCNVSSVPLGERQGVRAGRRIPQDHADLSGAALTLTLSQRERGPVKKLSQRERGPVKKLEPLVTLQMPLGDLYGEHWSTTGNHVPGARSRDDAVYLPGRNALLGIKPALWCAMHGIEELALAVLASNPFSDAADGFFRDFERVIERATGSRVRITRPFAHLMKKDVMELGRTMPLQLTFSCIAPVDGLHCGRCNKCAERRQAFRSVSLQDPTKYANKLETTVGRKRR